MNLPPGWTTVPLSDVILSLRNGLFASRPDDVVSGRPILRISAVRSGRIDMTDVKYVHGVEDDRATQFTVSEGDLLITRYNGTRRLVGVAARVPQVTTSVLHPDKLIRVVPDPAVVDSAYLEHYFASQAARDFIEARIKTSAGQCGIAGRELLPLPIALPPLPEQRLIVELLDAHLAMWQRATQDLARLRKLLSALRTATLHALDVQARGAASTTESLSEVAHVSGGLQKQPQRTPTVADPGWPFLRVANVGRRALDLGDVHRIVLSEGEKERTRLLAGDLLVVEGNGSPDQIGRAAQWHGAIDPCTHQNHLIRVRPTDSVDPTFLELLWSAPRTLEQLKQVASTTSGLYTLSTSKVGQVQLPIPARDVQEDLARQALAALTVVETQEAGLTFVSARLHALRRSLLTEALAGRLVAPAGDHVRVPSAPVDQLTAPQLVVGHGEDSPPLSGLHVRIEEHA